MRGTFYVVGTPIGNLQEITLRALETLKKVDVIFCEDTRRTIKLLNAYEIKKPLKSAPYFKEQRATQEIEELLEAGNSVAFVSDAGMPGISDPGGLVVGKLRAAGFPIEIVGGVSSLTSFLGGVGVEIESFRFLGFLPPRVKDREAVFQNVVEEPVIFFESPHRLESTLEVLEKIKPGHPIIMAKELSKISEAFYVAETQSIRSQIKSFKGEWIGCLFPLKNALKKKSHGQESPS